MNPKKPYPGKSLAEINSELAKEWHPTKNGKLSPFDLTPGSSKKVWWKCSRGVDHIWKASINDRTHGTGCPKCKSATSTPELRIFCELSSIFTSAQHRAIIKGYEVDIFIPDLYFGIEYDGRYWHQDKVHRDKGKNEALKSEIVLLRVRENGLPKLSSIDIELKTENISVATVKRILRSILKLCQIQSSEILNRIHQYLKRDDWIASDHFKKLYAERNGVVYEKSISYLYPDLAKQWHPTKNEPLLPEHFTPGSHKKIWWRDHIGKEWQAQICVRVGTLKKRIDPDQFSLFDDQG